MARAILLFLSHFPLISLTVLQKVKYVLVTNMNRSTEFCKDRDAGGREIIDAYQPHVNQADNARNE